jgi:CRP-like cAMP-binding protein
MDFGISRFLVNAPLLAGLDAACRAEIIARFVPRPFGDGELLQSRRAVDPGLLVVLDGGAEVWLWEGERRVRVAELRAGDTIGEIGFFAPELDSASDVVGRGTGMAALLPQATWRALVDEDHRAVPAIEAAIIRSLSFRLQYTLNTTLDAILGPSPAALASRVR